MTQEIKISIIICSYNRAAYIISAIDSLFNQTLSKDNYEVLVVDNNSIDNTGELVLKYTHDHRELQLKYMVERQQGASYARNTGAFNARGPLLCFMDDDALAENDYLQKIIAFFDTHPNASGLGGRIIPKYIPAEPRWMSFYVSSMVGNFRYGNIVKEFDKGKYPLESNMIVSKEDFNLVGGFNTNLPGVKGTLRIGGEGKDFFFKLYQLGKKVYYHPGVIVHHIVEVSKLTPAYLYSIASGYGRGEKIRTLAINKLSYFLKIIEYIYKLGGAVAIALIYIIKGKYYQSWPLIKFRIDALRGLLE